MSILNSGFQNLNCQGQLLDLSRPKIMAIVNLSPDSFYHSLDPNDTDAILRYAEKLLGEGADILDFGAMSTSPGSEEIEVELEWGRLEKALQRVRKEFPSAIISVDTYRSFVAEKALDAGANIINDISGGMFDPAIIEVVAKTGAPYILMHNRAKALEMQKHTHYDNLILEVYDYFTEKIHLLSEKGIVDIVIDPGFGFSKTIDQNYSLLKNLDVFKTLNRPLMVGISRKSMLHKTTGGTPDQVLGVGTALHFNALLSGAHILRVHDVAEAVRCIRVFERYSKA